MKIFFHFLKFGYTFLVAFCFVWVCCFVWVGFFFPHWPWSFHPRIYLFSLAVTCYLEMALFDLSLRCVWCSNLSMSRITFGQSPDRSSKTGVLWLKCCVQAIWRLAVLGGCEWMEFLEMMWMVSGPGCRVIDLVTAFGFFLSSWCLRCFESNAELFESMMCSKSAIPSYPVCACESKSLNTYRMDIFCSPVGSWEIIDIT